MDLGALATQASPRRSRQSGVVARMPIVIRDADSTPYRVPPCPSVRLSQVRLTNNRALAVALHADAFPTAHQTCTAARAEGEARRECAAKPKRSAGRGREDYGWGWAGGVTNPPP